MTEISKGTGIGIVVLGIVLVLIGLSMSPTRTIESCYQGTYIQGCSEMTVPNPFPRNMLIFAGILSAIAGLGVIGKSAEDKKQKSTESSDTSEKDQRLVDQIEEYKDNKE